MTACINKGTGAGGSNTNKNGLSYEDLTNLNTEYNILSNNKTHSIIQFYKNNQRTFTLTHKTHLYKYMEKNTETTTPKAHGCKYPDECYIDEISKMIFIIEKKFQQVPGSVCEKIQTPHFKLWQYNRTFPKYHTVYIYCLTEWFKNNCVAELQYLEHIKIPIFWGNDINYKNKIIDYILNYKLTPP